LGIADTPQEASGTTDERQETVSRLLGELRIGNRDALNELLPLVYDELHRLAHQQRRRWDDSNTLNSTALVHEAYLRLADQTRPQWSSRPHFLAVAATAMRQILLDYAKRKHALKREGNLDKIPLHLIEGTLTSEEDFFASGPEAIVALDEALSRLEKHDPRQSRIVECRFFGGMSIDDTAKALGVSAATVKRGWTMAQAWLYRDLHQHHSG
jgi:RNA polymerase sigma factor (TIGR02999 family)